MEKLPILDADHVVLEPWNHELLSFRVAATEAQIDRAYHDHVIPLLYGANPTTGYAGPGFVLVNWWVQELMELA